MPPVSTLSDPFFTLEQPDPSGAMAWRNLASLGKPTEIGAIVDMSLIPDPSREPAPTQDECARMKEEEWYKTFKRGSLGRDWSGFFADETPIEDRDSTLLSWIGGLVDHIYGSPYEGTPRRAYAVLYAAVEQMDPNKGGQPRDWLAWAWEKIGWAWQRRAARDQSTPAPLAAQSKERTVASGQPLTLSDLATKIRKWCPDSSLHDANSEAAMQFVMNMAIVALPKGYAILDRNGYYDPMNYAQKFLWPQLRAKGYEAIFPLFDESEDHKELSDNHLVRHLPFLHIKRIKARSGIPGATVEGIGTSFASFVLPIYSRRTDLTPEPSEEVTELFRAMVGEDQLQAFEHYLARALEIERPIAMAAFIGKPGTGKSFMAKALADCFWPPAPPVPGKVLVGDFQDELMTNPIVHLEETFPVSKGNIPVRDVLRQWIGGSSFLVNQKYDLKIDVDLQPRLLHTANNDNSLARLSTDEGNRDDQEAIIQRTIRFDFRPEAGEWLREHGGSDLTNAWIGGNHITPNYKMTKHLLWLYAQRDELGRPGSRFLVEGTSYAGAQELKNKVNDSEMRVEIGGLICRMLDSVRTRKYEPPNNVVIDDTGIWLTGAALMSFKDRERTPMHLPTRMAGMQLANLSDRQPTGTTERTCTSGTKQKARWYRLDIAELNRLAEDHGFPNDLLVARLAMMETPSAVPQS